MWLIHSAKGTTWANHKYIKIVNGRYIYPAKSKALELKSKINRGLRGMDKDQISYDNGKFTFRRYDNGRAISTTGPQGNQIYDPLSDHKNANYGNREDVNLGYSDHAQYVNGRLRDGVYPDDLTKQNYRYDHANHVYKYVDRKSKAAKEAIQRNQQANATMARTKKGTAAGRKRIQDDKAAATEKRIQKGLEAGRERVAKSKKTKSAGEMVKDFMNEFGNDSMGTLSIILKGLTKKKKK